MIHSAATNSTFATKMATGRHFRTLLKTLAAVPPDKVGSRLSSQGSLQISILI